MNFGLIYVATRKGKRDKTSIDKRLRQKNRIEIGRFSCFYSNDANFTSLFDFRRGYASLSKRCERIVAKSDTDKCARARRGTELSFGFRISGTGTADSRSDAACTSL